MIRLHYVIMVCMWVIPLSTSNVLCGNDPILEVEEDDALIDLEQEMQELDEHPPRANHPYWQVYVERLVARIVARGIRIYSFFKTHCNTIQTWLYEKKE